MKERNIFISNFNLQGYYHNCYFSQAVINLIYFIKPLDFNLKDSPQCFLLKFIFYYSHGNLRIPC